LNRIGLPSHHLPRLTEEDVQRILDVTQGVPLAIKIAAGLYIETGDINAATSNVDGKREIVDAMVRRYLLHTRSDESEKAKLYGLALIRRADESTAIAAILGLSPEQAISDYFNELSHLHRRYSFIFTEKNSPTLHQEVRHFLRLWLLERRKDPPIKAINQKLLAIYETALKAREATARYATLKERMQDAEWTNLYLDFAQQHFWLDPVEGIRALLPFMIAAAIYQRDINEEAAAIGAFFASQDIRPHYNQWWQWADDCLVYTTSNHPSEEELNALQELTGLSRQHCPLFPSWLPDYHQELEAALWWRMGEAYQYENNEKALEWYEKVCQLISEDALKQTLAQTYYDVALRELP